MFLANEACLNRGEGMPRVHRRIAWEVKADRYVLAKFLHAQQLSYKQL